MTYTEILEEAANICGQEAISSHARGMSWGEEEFQRARELREAKRVLHGLLREAYAAQRAHAGLGY